MTTLTNLVSTHIGYNYWAHRRVWTCVEKLTDAQFTQPLTYSIGSIHHQVLHTLWAEDMWLSRILDIAKPDYYTPETLRTRTDIRQKWDSIEQNVRQHLLPMQEADLLRVIAYQNMRGDTFQQSVLEIVLHVVNHGTDHRAQTLAMMHTLGAETIDQDLITYLRGVK